MRPEDALRPGSDDTTPYDILQVASLNSEDGTVNLWYGDQLVVGVPADTSYVNRRQGDVVRVDKGLLSWRVRGPVGPAADAASVTWSNVQDKPKLAGVTYGESAPGAGWIASVTPGVYVNGNGVYVQVAAGGGSGGSSGSQSPDPVGVTPSGRVVYQGGHRTTAINNGRPVQGSWGYNPPNIGAWFYGSDITTAAGKGTIAGISMWLARTSTGGSSGATRPRLYLLTVGSAPYSTPSLGAMWSPSVGLTWNDDAHYSLPNGAGGDPDFVGALASGAARGIAAANGGYIRFRDCGGLNITYA